MGLIRWEINQNIPGKRKTNYNHNKRFYLVPCHIDQNALVQSLAWLLFPKCSLGCCLLFMSHTLHEEA